MGEFRNLAIIKPLKHLIDEMPFPGRIQHMCAKRSSLHRRGAKIPKRAQVSTSIPAPLCVFRVSQCALRPLSSEHAWLHCASSFRHLHKWTLKSRPLPVNTMLMHLHRLVSASANTCSYKSVKRTRLFSPYSNGYTFGTASISVRQKTNLPRPIYSCMILTHP